MGGEDAHASDATGGHSLRHQPFLATEISGSIGPFTDPEKEKVLSNRTSRGILERLNSGVVQGAEGYVFELERRGYIKAGPYVPEVVLDFPEAVKELHREVLRAGREGMVALTSYCHREKLKDGGKGNYLESMKRPRVR